MSWLLLNITLAFELLIVYLVGVNVRNMLVAISGVREWMLPFGDDLMDIREEMTRFMDDVQEQVMPMMFNFRYIFITASLAVLANMAGHSIAWLPFLASVWFTCESALHLYHINWLGQALNENVDHAEQTIIERE